MTTLRFNQKRAAGYVRYSSDAQADSFSLEAQKRQISERAKRDGAVIVEFFCDEAQSAYRKKNRPGIIEMMNAARRGEFEVLYIHKVDRLARRVKWALEFVEELVSLSIIVVAVEQNFDLATPEGKLIFTFLSSLSEFYSDNLGKEFAKGKRERVLKGYHNGHLPWGYRSVSNGGRKIAAPIEELKPIVRGMFERYSAGIFSYQQIADWLNAQGVRTQRGRIFSKDTVRDFIQNPFYAGMVRYRGTKKKGSDYREQKALLADGKHEAIISKELFDHCQVVRESRRFRGARRQHTRRVYLLNGIIVCSVCGRRMRAQSAGKRNLYYREVSQLNGFDDCLHSGRSVHARIVDAQVAGLMRSIRLPPDWRQEVMSMQQGNDRVSRGARLLGQGRGAARGAGCPGSDSPGSNEQSGGARA
jgi:DNA invertase Pin-like site-specific DNA recombinase